MTYNLSSATIGGYALFAGGYCSNSEKTWNTDEVHAYMYYL